MCEPSICSEHFNSIKEILGETKYNMILPNLRLIIDSNKSSEKKKRTKHVIPLNESCFAKKTESKQNQKQYFRHYFDAGTFTGMLSSRS